MAADAPNAVAQVSAGKVGVSEWAVIVDADTASELPDGQIGGRLHGNNLGTGYWAKKGPPRPSSFGLKSRISGRAEAPQTTRAVVRTGDYGTSSGYLIAGRIKDLVIIDGRNHYPQDLECTAREVDKALRVRLRGASRFPASQLPRTVFDDSRQAEADPRTPPSSWWSSAVGGRHA